MVEAHHDEKIPTAMLPAACQEAWYGRGIWYQHDQLCFLTANV